METLLIPKGKWGSPSNPAQQADLVLPRICWEPKRTWKHRKEKHFFNYGGGIKQLMLHSGIWSRNPLHVKKVLEF